MSEALEQMLEEVKPDFSGNAQYSTLDSYAVSVPKDAMYSNIDSYLGGVIGLYSRDLPEPDFTIGNTGFYEDMRFDEGHKGADFPHLNLEVWYDLSTPGRYGNLMEPKKGNKLPNHTLPLDSEKKD